MEHKKVLKFLKIMGIIFVTLSVINIVFIIILNFTEFNFVGSSVLLAEFIYFGNLIPLSGTILWIFLNISMICFLLLGLFIYKLSVKDKIQSRSLAKYLVVIGMVLLINGLIKLNYLVLLGKVKLSPTSGSIAFQSALYDLDITSLIPAVIWVFFISADCCFMIGALFITATGIKWTLLQEETDSQK